MAVFILVDCILFLPFQASNLKNMHKKLTKIKSDLDSLEKDIKHKEEFIKEGQSLEKKLRDIQTRFLSKDDTALIISEINRISKDIGLDIANIKPQPLQEISKKGDSSFYYLPVDLRLNTGFHMLGGFLNRVEQLDFSLKLTQLEIKGEYPDLTVSMQICGIVRE